VAENTITIWRKKSVKELLKLQEINKSLPEVIMEQNPTILDKNKEKAVVKE